MSSSKEEHIRYVLDCFEDMGSPTKNDLYVEYKKLSNDDKYLKDWLTTTNYVPGKQSWVWKLLRRYGL